MNWRAVVALVGRERPATILKAEIERTLQSHGGLVFVAGEAGIGKTALVGDVVGDAGARGALVANGTCWDSDGAPGYWPWVQVLRSLKQTAGEEVWAAVSRAAGSELSQLLGELGTQRAGQIAGDSFGLHDAVTTLLVTISRRTPLVVILDDLHWADAASVRLLEFVARHAWFERLLVIGTYRDVEVEAAGHPLGALLQPIVAKATSITLSGLDQDAVGVLLAQTAGREPSEVMVAEVHHRTGGNPFFVDQTAQLWHTSKSVEAIAPGVRDAVERRLGMLPDHVVDVLASASVLGPEVSRDVLAAVCCGVAGDLSEHLSVAVTARLVVPRDDGRIVFVHDLVRETLYQSMDDAEAHSRHAAVLRAFERTPELRSRVNAAELAHHAYLAVPEVPAREAVALLRAAADDAWGRLAVEEAHGHLGRAYALASQDHPQEWAVVALEYGWAKVHVGELTASHHIFLEVAGLARELGDSELLARAALKFRGAIWLVATPESARLATRLVDEAHAALVECDGSPPESERERERELTARVVELSRRSGDDDALMDSLIARYDALWEPGTAAERALVAEEFSAAARRKGDRAGALFSTMLRVVDLLEQGDPRFRDEHQRFVSMAQNLNTSFSCSASFWMQATSAALEGRFDDAQAYLEESEAVRASTLVSDESVDDMAALSIQNQWAIALQRGELDAAAGLLLSPEALVHPYPDLLEAITALSRGDIELAWRYYTKASTGEPFARWFLPLWLRFQAQLAAATGDSRLCERARADLLPAAGQWLVMFCSVTDGPADLWTACIDAAEQRWDDAVRGFTAAWSSADSLGAVPWSLCARLHLAEALAARAGDGDVARATELFEGVERGAKELGIRDVAERAARRYDSPVPVVGPVAAAAPSVVNEFCFDGQVWSLTYEGHTVHMPDAKGLRDLHCLLGRPGADVAAVDLLASTGGETVRASRKMGADPVLDERAKAAYRTRLTQLDEEIDRAVQRGLDGRAAELDQERATLIDEIRRATGLGGRPRRLGDEAERARKAVSVRIRDTMRRLDERHPRLADHLRASVSTGARCSYNPADATSWSL
jgi:hypothetical protein